MGRKLTTELQKAGFSVTRDPQTATILFAHSGGCLLIPPTNQAQIIMQVGIPYQPGHSWLISTIKKVSREASTYREERRLKEWGRKWLAHVFYAWNIPAGIRMAQNQSFTKPWNNEQPQFIIRNRFDEFCLPDVVHAPFKGPRTFVSMPGGHDDCWDHPKPYVSLLQSLV